MLELQTLDPDYFQPRDPFDNYESLIWTERYLQAGDFELTSSNPGAAMAALPLESYVGLRNSVVPMIVEAHKINKPKGKAATVTITGRSFESVLERRGSVISLPSGASRAVWTLPADKQSDAAYKAMRMVIGDATARSNLPVTSPLVSPLDAFKRADSSDILNFVLPADYSTGLTNSYEIKAGNLYAVILELLEANHHGIKAVRPAASETTKRTINLEVYNGADLRSTVVFDGRFDQIDDAAYLLSYQGSTNIAYVYGGGSGSTAGGTRVRKNTVGTEVSGLDRRVLVVDEMSDATLSSDAIRTSRGLVELYKNNAIAIFDGETSALIGKKYNYPVSDGGYGLGDIVRLNGEFGLSRDVRVSEFIRVSDNKGVKSYPTFEVVDS